MGFLFSLVSFDFTLRYRNDQLCDKSCHIPFMCILIHTKWTNILEMNCKMYIYYHILYHVCCWAAAASEELICLDLSLDATKAALKIEVSWSAAGVAWRRGFLLPASSAGLALAAGNIWFKMACLKWSLEGPGGNIRYFKNDWAHEFSQHLLRHKAYLMITAIL